MRLADSADSKASVAEVILHLLSALLLLRRYLRADLALLPTYTFALSLIRRHILSSTSFSVQPVDLGAKLQKVNFGSERFQLEGYTTYHDIFAQKTAYNQGNNKKSDLSSGGGMMMSTVTDYPV